MAYKFFREQSTGVNEKGKVNVTFSEVVKALLWAGKA